MIIRIVLLFVLIVGVQPIMCAQGKVMHSKIIYINEAYPPASKAVNVSTFYDVETLSPVFEYITDTAKVDSNYVMYYLKDKKVRASLNVDYIGGHKQLVHYQDSLYWKEYNGTEMNQRALYSILFNDSLRIKDVKIVIRSGYDNTRFNFDSLIKRIVLSTEGKWVKNHNDLSSDYYFTFRFFYIR